MGRVDREGIEWDDQIQDLPSQQLGKAFDHYDMAKDGIARCWSYISPGYQPGRFPVVDRPANLPFMIGEAKAGIAAVDEVVPQIRGAQEMKDVKYCFAFVHDPARSVHSRCHEDRRA